jgi:hypothetical protein
MQNYVDEQTEGRTSEKNHPLDERVQPLGHETNRLHAIQQHGGSRETSILSLFRERK